MEIIPSVFSGVYVCCLRKVTRIDGTVESPPCLKVTQRSFGSQNSNTDIVFYRLSMPIECAEGFTKPAGGTLPANGSFFSPKKDLEDFETVSDFEVLMKTSHGHMSSNGPDKDRDEFNNHKDYNQEKPSKLKQRCVCVCVESDLREWINGWIPMLQWQEYRKRHNDHSEIYEKSTLPSFPPYKNS